MGCCGSLIKYLLFIFNFFFVLCGIALIVVGTLLLTDIDDFPDIASHLDTGVRGPQITLIVLGVIIFLIAFLGCCGAIKENKCMLITFGVLLLALFIAQLAIGIYAVVSFNDTTVEDTLRKIFDKHDQESAQMFDQLQSSLKCCGVTDATDYGGPGGLVLLPTSCCSGGICENGNYYRTGCAQALTDWFEDSGAILGGVAIGLGIVEIIGSVFAFYRAHQGKSFSKNLFKA